MSLAGSMIASQARTASLGCGHRPGTGTCRSESAPFKGVEAGHLVVFDLVPDRPGWKNPRRDPWRQSPSWARCSSSLRCTTRLRVPQGAPPHAAATGGFHSTSSAAATFSDSPNHSGVAVCGPMLMPAAARRSTVGASGDPTPSQRGRRWHRRQRLPVRAQELEAPGAVSDHLKPLLVHRAVVKTTHRS